MLLDSVVRKTVRGANLGRFTMLLLPQGGETTRLRALIGEHESATLREEGQSRVLKSQPFKNRETNAGEPNCYFNTVKESPGEVNMHSPYGTCGISACCCRHAASPSPVSPTFRPCRSTPALSWASKPRCWRIQRRMRWPRRPSTATPRPCVPTIESWC